MPNKFKHQIKRDLFSNAPLWVLILITDEGTFEKKFTYKKDARKAFREINQMDMFAAQFGGFIKKKDGVKQNSNELLTILLKPTLAARSKTE